MNSSKHTPAPWTLPRLVTAKDEDSRKRTGIGSITNFGGVCDIIVDNGKRIVDGGNDGPPLEEAQANAVLIAYTPILYEVLKSLLHTSDLLHTLDHKEEINNATELLLSIENREEPELFLKRIYSLASWDTWKIEGK